MDMRKIFPMHLSLKYQSINYHELDMALTLGTKLMSIDYNREVTAPSSDPWQSQNMIEYNVFAPQGKNDISSLFHK